MTGKPISRRSGGIMPNLRIDVYDEQQDAWRSFMVVPVDLKFKAQCGYSLHQFGTLQKRCACGKYSRGEDDGA